MIARITSASLTIVHIMNTSPTVAGAQVVDRIAAVLIIVSANMPYGIGTSDVARSISIARPSTHRLLTALAAQGFVDRDQQTGRWLLGPELFLMGSVAAERFDVTDIARPHIDRLSELTEESAYFSARRGWETVCLLRSEGSFPIRSFVLYEGKRFPLGVASAGLAILAFLPEPAIAEYLATASLEQEYGASHSPTELRARLDATRGTGYAVNPGLIVEGSWGMAAAVFDSNGQPMGALSLTGIESRFGEQRRSELGSLLLAEAHSLSERLTARIPGRGNRI